MYHHLFCRLGFYGGCITGLPHVIRVVSLSVGGKNKLASTSTTKDSVAPTHHHRERSCLEISPPSLEYTVTYRESFQAPARPNQLSSHYLSVRQMTELLGGNRQSVGRHVGALLPTKSDGWESSVASRGVYSCKIRRPPRSVKLKPRGLNCDFCGRRR
jgi:hypothetical protein